MRINKIKQRLLILCKGEQTKQNKGFLILYKGE